jgi:hypothetical protein
MNRKVVTNASNGKKAVPPPVKKEIVIEPANETKWELKHPIYGLYGYVLESKTMEVEKRTFIYKLNKYLWKWCTVFEIKKDEMKPENYVDCIASFIHSLLYETTLPRQDINYDCFKPFYEDYNRKIVSDLTTNENAAHIIEAIYNDSGFTQVSD